MAIRYIIKFLLIFNGLIIISCNNLVTESNLYGKWVGIYNNHEVILILNDDKSCIFKYYNEQTNNLETLNGNFELDLTKKPIPFTIRNIPQLNHQLHSIIEYVDDDSIRLSEFSSKWRLRPISFVDENTINLKRRTD